MEFTPAEVRIGTMPVPLQNVNFPKNREQMKLSDRSNKLA